MDALQAALEDALPAGINVPATGVQQMVFTDRNVPERTVRVHMALIAQHRALQDASAEMQVLLQVEVSNTSNWADAAFVTGSGKRIKAVLLHQVRPLRSATGHFLLQTESHLQHAACTQGLQAACC